MTRNLILLMTVTVLGCFSPPVRTLYLTPEIKPNEKDSSHVAKAPYESEPIRFEKILVKIPIGMRVGSHYEGLLKIRQFDYRSENSLFTGSEEFSITAVNTLKSLGYNILGSENLLFPGKGDVLKSRFSLGGIITGINYNTYGVFAGDKVEAQVLVEWQLYDSFRSEVVKTWSTQGSSGQSGQGGTVLYSAFRLASIDLGSAKSFREMVAQKKDENSSSPPKWDANIFLSSCSPNSNANLPNDFEKVFDPIVTIRAGQVHGAGVVVSPDGYILTAAHVVSGTDQVSVKFKSGFSLVAEVLRVNSLQDIALIRIPGSGHTCLKISSKDSVKIGMDIYAIGTPAAENLEHSVSRGIISGLRMFDGNEFIQTDASLNPGNSGGPILNKKGEILGIVSWKISGVGYEGLSFATPVSVIEKQLGVVFQKR